MAVGLEHSVVADYLRRLEAAAAPLPPARREELVAEIRGHVGDALAASGRDDEAAVREVLDRLGEPQDIVAAELEAEPAAPAAGGPQSAVGGYGMQPPRAVWGPVEVIAVVGLTIGAFVIPVVGPIVGLVCAIVSDRWTGREKVVAALWTVVSPLLILVAGVVFLFGARVETSGTVEQVDPMPAVSAPVAVTP